MSQRPTQRGPHPRDAQDLGPKAWPKLREAAVDLGWLLGRGYKESSALRVVGDKFQLSKRQRDALIRSACSGEQQRQRAAKQVRALEGRAVHVDAFNVLICVERALGGGPLLLGCDGAYRDLGGVHGSWRSVDHTLQAITLVGQVLAPARSVHWWIDRPVSNSGKLAGLLRQVSEERDWLWQVSLEDQVDPVLLAQGGVSASADSWILDECQAWTDLLGPVLAGLAHPWVVDFTQP